MRGITSEHAEVEVVSNELTKLFHYLKGVAQQVAFHTGKRPRPTSVPEVPGDAASCPSSLSINRNWNVWLIRGRNRLAAHRCRVVARCACRWHRQAMLDRETADAMNDRKNTTLLEVQRVALTLGCN